METAQISNGLELGIPASIIETALKVFDDADELTELPVLAFVPLVNESDWREEEPPVGQFKVFKEFVRKAILSWLMKRKLDGHVPMI